MNMAKTFCQSLAWCDLSRENIPYGFLFLNGFGIRLNGSGYLFQQKIVICSNGLIIGVSAQADHPLSVGAIVDWNLGNNLLLFIEEIHVNNTVAIICSKMQNLKQMFQ